MLTKLWTNSINAIQNDNGTAFFLQIVNVYFPFSVICVRFSSLNFDCARFKWLILLFGVFLHRLIWQLSHFIGRSFLSACFNRKISMQFFFAQQVIIQVFVFILFACGCQLWMLFVSFWVGGKKPRTIYSFYFKSINFQIDCSDWRFCLSFTFRFARLNILERKNWGNLNVCIQFFDRVNKHFSRGFCIGNISVVLYVCLCVCFSCKNYSQAIRIWRKLVLIFFQRDRDDWVKRLFLESHHSLFRWIDVEFDWITNLKIDAGLD